MVYNTPVDKNTVLVSGAILFKEVAGVQKYFVIKEPNDDKWQFVKLIVRKGESSVRAVIRIMGERGAMTVRVLEEAGRFRSVSTNNGKALTQNNIYYIMLLKSSSKEAKAFGDVLWLDYIKASKKLSSKKEAAMLKNTRDILKEWEKKRKRKKLQAS